MTNQEHQQRNEQSNILQASSQVLELTTVVSMRKRVNARYKKFMETVAASTEQLADEEFVRKGEVRFRSH